MKFVIVTTQTYTGGNVVLRELCRLLIKKGHYAKIIAYSFEDLYRPRSFTYLLFKRCYVFLQSFFYFFLRKLKKKEDPFAFQKCPHKIFPIVDDNTIAVYSEGVYGNPLRAKKIIRWFLYFNRHLDEPDAYGKNELIFSFRQIFNDYNLNPTCRLFTLYYFNSKLYKQYNFEERTGCCYIIRKGGIRTDLPQTFDGPVIDNLPEKEKVSIFNKCKYCYDYDTQTYYTAIAAVCGCIPVVMMEPRKKKSDYLGENDVDYGCAYGNKPEEIAYAIETRDKLIRSLEKTAQNEKNLDFFIREVSQYLEREHS